MVNDSIGSLFFENVTTPSKGSNDPLVMGVETVTKAHAFDSFDEAMDSMELSLEMQHVFSGKPNQVVPMAQKGIESLAAPGSHANPRPSPHQKVDKRVKPHSTCKRRNRRRPKHELEYLRATVVELQKELEVLRKADDASSSALGHEIALGTIESKTASWKEMVQRQELLVHDSMRENRRLWNRLLSQLEIVRAMDAAISQHQTEARCLLINGTGRVRQKSDQEIFAELHASVAKQLGEVNTVLTTTGLTNVLHQLRGGFEFKREANGISFRHEEARLLPFSMESLHHAIWNCLHDRSAVKKAQAHSSSLIIRETLELPRARRINITKRSVFGRHFEPNGIIFVWASNVEIDGSVCVRLRERGWSTCSRFESYRGVQPGASSSSNFTDGCFHRMAIKLTPEVSEFESEQETQRHIGAIADLIVGSYDQSFRLIHEIVEEMLLRTEPSLISEAGGDQCGKVVAL